MLCIPYTHSTNRRDLMDDTWVGKRVLVMGLGRFGGGVGVCRFLADRGAGVTVTDTAGETKLADSLAQLADLRIDFRLGGHNQNDFADADLIVVNPAVPRNSPWLDVAREHDVPLASEMNLFFERCPARIVGITGSNGKSTTAAMTHHILQGAADAGRLPGRMWLGGNIGRESLLCRLDEISSNDIVVLELSSFQLYDLGRINRSPHVAVVTNLSPNHLDWHGTMEAYAAAKQNILRYQNSDDIAILNRLDPSLSDWAELAGGLVRWYPQPDEQLIQLSVPGHHNQINASAALAAAMAVGVDADTARLALAEYTSLPHRLELVGTIAGVRYYNDSIATTPESTIAALDAFPEKKVMILGGYDKKISFATLVERMVGGEDVVDSILLGQVRDELARLIKEQTTHKRPAQKGPTLPACHKVATLGDAVKLAQKKAQSGMIVLLSPACASYDMFRNFQDRGDQFRQLVESMSPVSG